MELTCTCLPSSQLLLFLQALLNTVLVIGIVGASSVVLFAINSTLAELSKFSYK